MSEYATIKIKKLSLYWFRNYLDSRIVGLFFSPNDLVVTNNYYEEPGDEDCEPITKYEYRTTVKKACDRLDALGYDLGHMGVLFEKRKHDAISYGPFLSHLKVNYDQWDEKTRNRIDKNVSFKKWSNSIKKVIEYELNNGNIDEFHKDVDINISTECDKVIYNALIEHFHDSFYAMDTNLINIAFVLRLILEYAGFENEVILDFTHLGYWADDSIPKALEAAGQMEKNIVLVEGTSDKDILEFALNRMYPHLADLFYFMDFSDGFSSKRAGGTSEISKCMETFFYSRLKARFIAVFDNDAEGYSSMIQLQRKVQNWPDNFRIMCYPCIELLKKYPTLAPNGQIMLDDVNRKAGSIELYLPDCILKNGDNYYPVEWEARKKLKTSDEKFEYLYQGVVSDKDEIKKRFHSLQKRIHANKYEFQPREWDRMNQLLNRIVFAFAT